jgi:hypothetical protein
VPLKRRRKNLEPSGTVSPAAIKQLLETLEETLDEKSAPPEPPPQIRLYHNVERPHRERKKWQKSDQPGSRYMTSESELRRQRQPPPKAKPKRDAE